MARTTVDAIRTILENLMAETDDAEIRFKLRTGLQLLYVVEEDYEAAQAALAEADLDEETRANLRELGYLD